MRIKQVLPSLPVKTTIKSKQELDEDLLVTRIARWAQITKEKARLVLRIVRGQI
jgi:hypothetical protein